MTKWLNLYSFDVMGDLAFGKSYKMLDSGEKHWLLKLLGEGMDPSVSNSRHSSSASLSLSLAERTG